MPPVAPPWCLRLTTKPEVKEINAEKYGEDVLNVSHIWAFQYEARHVIRISQRDSEWALRSMQEVNGTVSQPPVATFWLP